MNNYIVLDNIQQWNEISQNSADKTIVIMATSNFCNPCRQIKPKIRDLSLELTDVLFLIVDVEKFSQIVEHFGINSMPTFVIIKNNQIVKTIVGGDLVGIRVAISS